MPDLLKRAALALGLSKGSSPVNRKRRNLYGSDGNIPYKVDDRGNLIKKRSYKSSALGKSLDDLQIEAEEKDSMVASMQEKTNRFFFLSIPETLQESVSNLPTVYIFSFGLLANLLFLGSFVFFTNYTYEANISSPFLAASKESGVCQDIGKEISGTFLFDSNGLWSGSKGFLSNEAIYRFDFINYAPNGTESYSQFIDAYKTNFLDDISSLSVNQTLPINLLYWMKFRATITTGTGQKQVMRLTGSSGNVFDTKKYIIGLSSSAVDMGQCASAIKPSHAYYRSSSTIIFSWTESLYSDSCFGNVTASTQLGYESSFDGTLFSLAVDFETLMSVVAINWGGIIQLSEMTEVTNATVVTYRGFSYAASYFFDDTMPAMKAFLCLKLLEASSYYSVRNNFDSFCFVELGKYFAIPLFNHLGYSHRDTSAMTQCTCPTVDDYCHKADLLVGALFYPNENYANPASDEATAAITGSSARLSMDLLELAWNYTAKELNSATYDAMIGTTNSIFYSNNEMSSTAYSFCNDSCAIMVINSYTEDSYPKVSDYYHYLTEGSCSNSFVNDEWDKITSSTPAPLLENYVLCTPTIRDAFQNALGVAQGLATTVHPFLLVICLPLIYIFLKYNGLLVYLEETYSKADKEITLNELAEYILLVRDGRRTNLPEGSTVEQLATEMIVAARNHILDEEARIEQMYDEFKNLKKLRSKRRLSNTNALKERVKGKLKVINRLKRGAAGSALDRGEDPHEGGGVTLTPSFSTHIDVAINSPDSSGDVQSAQHPLFGAVPARMPATAGSEKHFRRYSSLPAHTSDGHEKSILAKFDLAGVFEAGSGVEEKQETAHFNELNKELTGLLSFLDPVVVNSSSSDDFAGAKVEKNRLDNRHISFDVDRPLASDVERRLKSVAVDTSYSSAFVDDDDDVDEEKDEGGKYGDSSSVSSFSDEEVQKIPMPLPPRLGKARVETLHEL